MQISADDTSQKGTKGYQQQITAVKRNKMIIALQKKTLD
jgi:hypothetical protein